MESLQRIIDGHTVQGIFQPGGIAFGNVNAVVVQLVQDAVMDRCLQLPEGIPQWELIQGIFLKIRHKGSI